MLRINADIAFGLLYCLYAVLIARLNSWPQVVTITKSNLFVLAEMAVGVAFLGLHLWAVLGATVFLAFLKICVIAGVPMTAALGAVELLRHARESAQAEQTAASESKAAAMRGER